MFFLFSGTVVLFGTIETAMQTVLLLGGTGSLGKKIAGELAHKNFEVQAVVRNRQKATPLEALGICLLVADVTDPVAVKGICNGIDVVVSALGKSVSPTERGKASFEDVDVKANSLLLEEAIKSGVKKFLYVSAFHAERYPHLTYFRVHHQFSQRLKQSGLDYTIVKPPALFSAFLDLVQMAKQGRLITLGRGDKLTNPIYEGDLAKICVDAIEQRNAEIEAGGPDVLSRRQINNIIQAQAAPANKVRTVPLGLVKATLPLVKLFSKNLYDKAAFFTEVMQHDTVAPKAGTMRLEEYVRMKCSQ